MQSVGYSYIFIIMETFDSEKVSYQLNSLTSPLRLWYGGYGPSHNRILNLSDIEYQTSERNMVDLVHGVKPKLELRLRIGETAIIGTKFTKGAYDNPIREDITIDPDTALPIVKAQYYPEESYPSRKLLYVGDAVLISLNIVAETLCNGGDLTIVTPDTSSIRE